MAILPFRVLGASDDIMTRWTEMFVKMAAGNLMPPCDYYDLHLDPEVLQKMVVTPSPRMSAGNTVLLNSLLESQGLTDNLRQSELEGML